MLYWLYYHAECFFSEVYIFQGVAHDCLKLLRLSKSHPSKHHNKKTVFYEKILFKNIHIPCLVSFNFL